MKIMKNELADNSASRRDRKKALMALMKTLWISLSFPLKNKLFPNDDLGSIVLKIIACTREVLWKIAGRETRKALAC